MVESLAKRTIFPNFAYKITKNRAMEKIILFLIIFGIGSLYEYIKQLREKRAGAEDAVAQQKSRPQGLEGAFRQFFDAPARQSRPQGLGQAFKQFFDAPVQRQKPSSPRQAARPARTERAAESIAPTASAPVAPATPAGSRSAFLPGELLEMKAPVDDTPMEVAELEPVVPPADATENKALADHYARWRQAIIDTTIITPKFDQPKV